MLDANGATIWLTGLSASGKSTLSEVLFQDLKKLGVENVVILDGEAVRDQFENDRFDLLSREEIGNKKIQMALEQNQMGKIVIISGIAHKKEWRKNARDQIKNYFEVYLDASADDCAKRDYKGHYSKAIKGEINNFVGITEPYEADCADLILHTGKDSIESCSKELLKNVLIFLQPDQT